jgi:DNA-binding response OmpR family regulator
MSGRGRDLVPVPGGLSGSGRPSFLTVLFVDPELNAAERLASPLRATCAVAVVPTVQAALAAIRVRMPDLVVTELDLPDMRGVEFIATLHNAPATHSVLLMVVTNRSSVRDKIAAFQAGADHYLVKPVEPEQFLVHMRLVTRFRAIVSG